MIKYKVYRQDTSLGNSYGGGSRIMLVEVDFSGWVRNSFDTVEQAVQACKEDEHSSLNYEELLILPTLYLN